MDRQAMTNVRRAPPTRIYLQLDMCAMLCVRQMLHQYMTDGYEVTFALYADGSPSSGFEAFIAVENMTTPFMSWTRMLPITILHYGAGPLMVNVFCLLWKPWLETGQTWSCYGGA